MKPISFGVRWMVPEAPASNMWGFGEHVRVKVLGCSRTRRQIWTQTLRCGILSCPVESDGNGDHQRAYVPILYKLPGGQHGDALTIYRVPRSGESVPHMGCGYLRTYCLPSVLRGSGLEAITAHCNPRLPRKGAEQRCSERSSSNPAVTHGEEGSKAAR